MGKKSRQGFTLVELLVVVTIIAVLAAIAVPAYTRYQDSAKLAVSISLLDTLRKDLEIYREKYSRYPEKINFGDFTDQNGTAVVVSVGLDVLRSKMFSWDIYTAENGSYAVTCRAIDSGHTVLNVTPGNISH